MVPRISICFTDLTNFSFTKSFVSALEGAGIYAVFFLKTVMYQFKDLKL